MPAPLREQIMDDLRSTFEGITTGNGYTYDMQHVFRGTPAADAFQETPAVAFDDLTETYEHQNNAAILKTLPIHIEALHTIGQWNGDEELRQAGSLLLAGLEKALMADPSRGGLAIDTLLNSATIDSAPEGSVFAILDITVKYRVSRTDPTAKV